MIRLLMSVIRLFSLFNRSLNPFNICSLRGTYREKGYSELDLGSLQNRCWCRKLCIFYKILNSMSTKYLSDIIPSTIR